MKRNVVVFALALLAGLLATAPAYADLTVSDIESEVMCQCGCVMVLETCQCGTAEQMRTLIGDMIDEGQTKGQILDYFVAQYGEDALSVPAKQGFNLVVWVLPFAAIIGGGAGLYFLLRSWAFKGRTFVEEEAIPELQPRDEADEYQQRFEQEFEQFQQEEDTR